MPVRKEYYTTRNSKDLPILPLETDREVAHNLRSKYIDTSDSTGYGRVYYVLNYGMVEHHMGPQPTYVVKARTRRRIRNITKRVGLPL